MILNQTSVSALRAMAALAGLGPGETLRAADLAERTGVPVHYLSKIMSKMVEHRLVVGRKGHGGGFALCRPAREIRVADVLEASDFHVEPGTCAFGWGDCDPRAPCPLHTSWSRLQEFVLHWADETTLEDTRTGSLPGAADPETPVSRRRGRRG